jgi:hypothetical protein
MVSFSLEGFDMIVRWVLRVHSHLLFLCIGVHFLLLSPPCGGESLVFSGVGWPAFSD